MKKIILSRLTERQKEWLRRPYRMLKLVDGTLYDMRRFRTASTAVRVPHDRESLAAHLTMDYHRLEKGMALPDPRYGFGQDALTRLIRNLPQYQNKHGEDALVSTVLSVLRSYENFHANVGHPTPRVTEFLKNHDRTATSNGGTFNTTLDALFPFDTADAEVIQTSRHSVRQYTGDLVPAATLDRIVQVAQSAPSVCNRQSGHVFVANTRESMTTALGFQNGNRGFGHKLGAVFIVAADMRAFTISGERNQAFVDGGIFAMSILQAIHAQKLGGCMLNWSVDASRDRKMRSALNIPDHYAIITMIGCGYSVETPDIATSTRIPLDQVVTWV